MFSKKTQLFWLLLVGFIAPSQSLKLDRAIVACDANPKYLEFWPLVARAWQQLIGIKPTLILVADETVQVDENLGEVYRFTPLAGIPTWFQAQNIRLLFPVKFPNEVCIISDMDMLPLSQNFFTAPITKLPDDSLAVYRDGAYGQNIAKFPMCYIAAKGAIFGEIFQVKAEQDIKARLQEWFDFEPGWETDELALYAYLKHWPDYNTKCFKLGFGNDPSKVLDRTNWHYDKQKLLRGEYYQAHLPRPYMDHKAEIDKLVELLNLNNKHKSNRKQSGKLAKREQ